MSRSFRDYHNFVNEIYDDEDIIELQKLLKDRLEFIRDMAIYPPSDKNYIISGYKNINRMTMIKLLHRANRANNNSLIDVIAILNDLDEGKERQLSNLSDYYYNRLIELGCNIRML